MTQDEIIQLVEKVAKKTATPQEQLLLIQEMDQGIDVLNGIIKAAKQTQNHD